MIKGINSLTGYNIIYKIYMHILSKHLNINRYLKNLIATTQMNLEDILYQNKPDTEIKYLMFSFMCRT